MTILEYYIEKSKDNNWYNKYFSCAKENYGNTFGYTSTNFRDLYSFLDVFPKFLNYQNLDRTQWKRKATGQEMAKHWTSMMTQSKLFKKNNGLYSLTAKGECFQSLLNSKFNRNEQWIMIYFILQNSYFNFKINYIPTESQNIFSILKIYESENISLKNEMTKSLKLSQNSKYNIEEIFKTDLFWHITMYTEESFLQLYSSSTIEEKSELHNYVIYNHKHKINSDPVARKYKSTNYSKPSYIDSIKTLYTSEFIDKKLDFINYYTGQVNNYNSVFNNVDIGKIMNFILQHKSIFEVIYNEVVGNIEKDLSEEYEYTPRKKAYTAEDIGDEKIDDTTSDNSKKLEIVSSVLKRLAKEKSGFKCEGELLHQCKYFTAKENGQNYLEIHHLIPREFSNEFENSIEVIDNYVALCPSCHRRIHLAIDRERESLLNFLYYARIEKLKSNKLNPTLEDLKIFYNIEE